MGAQVTLRQAAARSTAHLRLPLLLALLLALGLLAYWMAAPSPVGAETVANAAGRYDGLVLRDLGGKRAALVCLIAENGAFTPVELWRSKPGAFDTRKAKFLAGDVNGDGIADGIALYDLGSGRSRLSIWLSDGHHASMRTAWTSKAGAFSWARAKLATGDLDRDGMDDVIALYDRGRGAASLYRFISTGKTLRQSLGWSGALSVSSAQLVAGDLTGDGRADAVMLSPSSAASASLLAFVSGTSTFTKKTFWKGAYAAGRARLTAGDADSDGKCDAIALYRKPNGTGRLDVFRSTGTALLKPAVWYDGAAGALPAAKCRLAAGDVTGDGRADVVLAQPTGGSSSRITTCVAGGSRFQPRTWWSGGWAYAAIQLAAAPSPGLVVTDDAEVLDATSLRSLRKVSADGATLTFAGQTGQLSRTQSGDVLFAMPSPTFPDGMCRKVTGVSKVGGQLVVTTSEAMLSDVIDQGEVAFSKRITAADLSPDGIVYPGVRLLPGGPPLGTFSGPLRGVTEGFGIGIDTTILGKVAIEGSVWLDPSAYVDYDLGWSGLESASYTQTLTTSTDISVSIKQDYSEEKEVTLYEQTLGVITIMAGPWPVFVTPTFKVYVSAEGEVSAGVTAGVSVDTETSVGIGWDEDDGWSPPAVSFSKTYDWSPPQLFSTLTLTGAAGAGLSFEVYAVAGPEAKLEAFLELVADADPEADPWWTLDAGARAKIGFKVETLDYTWLEQEYELALFKERIDQAGSATSGGGSSHYETPSVRGKILEAGGSTPIAGASVELRSAGGSTVSETRSAADGTYVFSGEAAGQYTVVASKSFYAEASRAVTVIAGQLTPNQDLSLVPDENQGVRGRALSSPGAAPVGGTWVGLWDMSRPLSDYPDGIFWDGRYVWGDGSYRFLGVPAGQYRLYASAPSYFPASANVTIGVNQIAVKDLLMVPYEAQGIHGFVKEALTDEPIAGASVELHEGSGSPAGELLRTRTTAADGSFAITGLDVGDYTLVVDKPGFLTGLRDVTCTSATITSAGTIVLQQPGGNSMRSSNDSCIRWTEATNYPSATYEFWFRPTEFGGMEYGNTIAQISRDYPDWMDDGPHRWPTMQIQYGSFEGHTVFSFILNENMGDEMGKWHRVTAETPIQLGHWYHVAAQHGSRGMRLFINGMQEGYDDYVGGPQPNQGVAAGGWFSLGDNHTLGSGYMSAVGDFRGLEVSSTQIYYEDFTPPGDPLGGDSTMILDELISTTNGENLGFVPTP